MRSIRALPIVSIVFFVTQAAVADITLEKLPEGWTTYPECGKEGVHCIEAVGRHQEYVVTLEDSYSVAQCAFAKEDGQSKEGKPYLTFYPPCKTSVALTSQTFDITCDRPHDPGYMGGPSHLSAYFGKASTGEASHYTSFGFVWGGFSDDGRTSLQQGTYEDTDKGSALYVNCRDQSKP